MRRLFAIFFVFLTLTTSMGLAVTTHFCGGRAVKSSFAVGISNLSCGINNAEFFLCDADYGKDTIHKKNCCENKYAKLSIENDYKSFGGISILETFNFVSNIISCSNCNSTFDVRFNARSIKHLPPLIKLDSSTLFQVFRI